jgi:hypothetical protein
VRNSRLRGHPDGFLGRAYKTYLFSTLEIVRLHGLTVKSYISFRCSGASKTGQVLIRLPGIAAPIRMPFSRAVIWEGFQADHRAG